MAPKRSREVMDSKLLTMGRSSKRPSVAEDRLSSLPDHLLHNIMSFLTARQAVHTCVLSRRWRSLWCSMPCLDIDQREEFGGWAASSATVDRTARELECVRFEDFVNNLLMFHSASSLDKLRCHVTGCTTGVFKRWICHGIKCSPAVSELEILFPYPHGIFSGLPSGFTSCRLGRLHLSGIVWDTSCTQLLHSGCPVLEDLQLHGCLLDSSEITSHTLKKLTVTDCTSYFDKVLTITAPALASFHLAITAKGSYWKGIMVNEMPSLVKASVSVCSESLVASCKLLCSLVNVQMLELFGSETLSLLHMGSNTFPTFHNLRTLLFDGCNLSDDFKILGRFLTNAPSLEKLTLHYCVLPGHQQRTNRTVHPVQILTLQEQVHPSKQFQARQMLFEQCLGKITLQCANLKWTEIRKKLSGKWSKLQNSSITVTKA